MKEKIFGPANVVQQEITTFINKNSDRTAVQFLITYNEGAKDAGVMLLSKIENLVELKHELNRSLLIQTLVELVKNIRSNYPIDQYIFRTIETPSEIKAEDIKIQLQFVSYTYSNRGKYLGIEEYQHIMHRIGCAIKVIPDGNSKIDPVTRYHLTIKNA